MQKLNPKIIMESIKGPSQTEVINDTTILDSTATQDLPQTAGDVETEDSNIIKQYANESDHLQHETAEENQTTNIQLQLVDKADDTSDDNDEKPMDINNSEDDVNENQKNSNYSKAQPMEAAAELQTQPRPQSVEHKTHSNITNDEGYDDGTISNKAKKCKYEESKETEEDELLKSDSEEENIEEPKEKASIVLDSISMEQEEELLKSEDEDEEEEYVKEIMKINEEKAENENNEPKHFIETNKNETEEEIEKIPNESENNEEQDKEVGFDRQNQDEIETDNINTDNVCQELENSKKSSLQTLEHQHLPEHIDDENQTLEINEPVAHQSKNKSSENHRILYQFDLDDDSSSQDSFQCSKSPKPTQSNQIKEENNSDDSSTSREQILETVAQQSIYETLDIKSLNYNTKAKEQQKENNKEETTKPAVVASCLFPEKDLTKSNDGSDIPSLNSSCVTSHKSDEEYSNSDDSDDEARKQTDIPSTRCSQIASPRSDVSSSDVDLDKNVKEKYKTKENSNNLTDSLTNDLYKSDENLTHAEKEQHEKISFGDNLLDINEVLSNDGEHKNHREKENLLQMPKLNGDHDSQNHYNETGSTETSNDSHDKNSNASKKMSLESNICSSPQQHLPCNSTQKEETRSECHEEINEMKSSFGEQESEKNNLNDNDSKMVIESDNNENSLKINENSGEHYSNAVGDETANKTVLSFTPPQPILNEEDEASRSSLASSVSYSSNTSSSQHLVIDHPMDDVKEEKVQPLKISLKRKLSTLSDDGDSMGPNQKQFHLCDQMEDSKNSLLPNKEQKTEQHEMLTDFQKDENMEVEKSLAQRYEDRSMQELEQHDLALENNDEKSTLFLQQTEAAEASRFKSLLLQQLEKPLAIPNVTANLNSSPLTSSPITFTPTSLPTPPLQTQSLIAMQMPTPSHLPPPDTGVTKYLCFKCKTGSFDTFAALTDHQATCLVSRSLFPCNQTTIGSPLQNNPTYVRPNIVNSATAVSSESFLTKKNLQSSADLLPQEQEPLQPPTTSTSPPAHTLEKSTTLSPIKAADFNELKEIITSPSKPTVPSTKKRYYKCSTCNTFHENWNLFLHIREQHNRHMCLYCVRFFPTAEKLALHLEIKHDLEQNHFNSEEALRKSIPVLEGYALETRFLMCCICQHIFTENEQFSQHDCSEYIKPCSLCGQKGRHTNQCKAHPDSKRFSKLKKKKEKHMQPLEKLASPTVPNERIQMDFTVPPITISNHNVNPTIISNSNLSCDSGRTEKNLRPQTKINSMHSEDSNSSSNMVIDESCNTSHITPAQTQPQLQANLNHGTKPEISNVQLEPDLPPDKQHLQEAIATTLPPLKLVVPKFKLRVPKEFQKSVDDALSTSDSEEEVDDEVADAEEEEEQVHKDNVATEKYAGSTTSEILNIKEADAEKNKNFLLAESTPANSQDMEIERNSATESATEAGNSQDVAVCESTEGNSKSQNAPSLPDDDDSLDEPNSNLVRIMQEIERTKMDIQRTKKTSYRHNKSFALPRQPTVSQTSSRTADHNWSPTPPASPNSRWFTPRRSTISQSGEEQLQKTPQHQQFLLPPPSPVKQSGPTLERRDTIGSDMMDIDETITSQPTQTIYSSHLRPLDNENLNTSGESVDIKSNVEPMETNQISDNAPFLSDVNSTVLETENSSNKSILNLSQYQHEHVEHENKIEINNVQSKPNSSETAQNTDISLTQITHSEIVEKSMSERNEDEGDDDTEIDVCENKDQENIQTIDNNKFVEMEQLPPSDGIEVANDDTVIIDLQLDRPLDKYEIIDFVRICLKAVYPLCLYCNHARRIAVNGKSLVLHIIGHHRFTATVDSITAEELLPATIVAKLKSFLPDLEEHYFNSNSYCTYGDRGFRNPFNERIFECFQCRFVTSTHKELYLHNRKMHLRTAILCFMCRANFFSFSEILCHVCPGVPNKVSVFDVKFRCCLCELDNIPSPFRLMVHLRKKHFACDVCLEDCRDQSKLSSHVWKHKLHHLCYRCGIAYRNKLDITKHLFWKHGTESTICKRCLQKRWRHVYHFCIPPITFECEVCNLCFSKAMYLRVHKRLHSGDLRYPCIEDNCEEKFISRKLLLKHASIHEICSTDASAEKTEDVQASLDNKDNESNSAKELNAEDIKSSTDLQNIKQEVMEIKKEPLDESEIECHNVLKHEKSESAEKETKGENGKTGCVKDCKNSEIKEKKHLNSNEPRKKRKKSKRSKELLEDLNLTAPNLSESDSSNDSDSDSDSKTKSEIDALPRVMLSPPSEAENEDKDNKTSETVEPGQVLEIWKNFLKTQQGSSTVEELERLKASRDENPQPKPMPVHVACSDHDYCKIEPEPPAPIAATEPEIIKPKDDFKKPTTEVTSTPETSPTKRKQSKSPRRRLSSRRSNASSSSSNSSSSSDSSCSCGSNCSCSSSGSESSSSSSSSEDSDSSMASNNSVRKRHRKKSERDRIRKRSESASPLKQHKLSVSISEVINVDDEDTAKDIENIDERPHSPPKEPLFYESDLETNESDTDEEFYDEHPQKLANELLAQKRAQLMAQTRLSPSHNYDIVENSRPSTPSLPEEVATNEKPKIKVKKKKRDRKSSCKGQGLHSNHVPAPEQTIAPAQTVFDVHQPANTMMEVVSQPLPPPASLINPVIDSQLTQPTSLYTMPQNIMAQTIYAPPPSLGLIETTLTPRPLTMPPYGHSHRMSEGSSCSDADGSLKRSKRQRRPNKFYGYTSDDENLMNCPPLMIGTRAFKPQPPPQLTWHKEDLPTPSKSILNSKNKTQRTPKTPATPGNPFVSSFSTSASKKKSRLSLTCGEKSARKRPAKKKDAKTENNFPPIPTLKIRPSEIGLNTTINHSTNNTTDDTSSDEDITKRHFSASTSFNAAIVNQPAPAVVAPIILPSQPPAPPTPQTTAFNHRIPPALLPNPDFATLQYFKANNIRYPIRPPAGARQPREGESVYCYCRCPYDEVSEMIACDGENCLIEWFHFECVGIMVAPQGKWFCAECRPKYSEELYPSSASGQLNIV